MARPESAPLEVETGRQAVPGGGPEGIDRRFARAATTVWVVVNLVNLLQAMGFASRPDGPELQRVVGIVIAGLAIPASLALAGFVRVRAGPRWYAGPVVFDAFVGLLVVVEYLLAVEFRSPPLPRCSPPFSASSSAASS